VHVSSVINEAHREAEKIVRKARESVPNNGVSISYSEEYIEAEVQRRVDAVLSQMGIRDK
jgi:hypothetical protein